VEGITQILDISKSHSLANMWQFWLRSVRWARHYAIYSDEKEDGRR